MTGRRQHSPAMYVVRWGDVWKAGYCSDKSRWRKWVNRGAELVSLTQYERGVDALVAKSLVEGWLSHLGHPAFRNKAEARELLGDGGGWTECYCLCGVDATRISDSHDRSVCRIARPTPTYETYGTDVEPPTPSRANLMLGNAHASRKPDLGSEAAVERWAAAITGCDLVDWYCATHNLSWVMCRWMDIAAAIYHARREGRAEGMRLGYEYAITNAEVKR